MAAPSGKLNWALLPVPSEKPGTLPFFPAMVVMERTLLTPPASVWWIGDVPPSPTIGRPPSMEPRGGPDSTIPASTSAEIMVGDVPGASAPPHAERHRIG